MKLPVVNLFFISIVVLISAAVFPVFGQGNSTYQYTDNFSSNKVEDDAYFHSIFWPEGAFPPPEPYLYYTKSGQLGFGDEGQSAYLAYYFPIDSEILKTVVSGYIEIDVNEGELSYSLSSDGFTWSPFQEQGLEAGTHKIPIDSVGCYIIFYGAGTIVDNLKVYLYSSPITIHVPDDYSTIQLAIDKADNGSIIEVAPNTYSGDGFWDIDFRGKAITVLSEAGPEHTIIDCRSEEEHRGFYFNQGEDSNSVLRGFTIIGGYKSGSEIPHDYEEWYQDPNHPIGGGIYCEYSSPSIIDCIIKECSTELGGGIGIVGGSPEIIDCVIEDCNAGGFGPAESGGLGAGIGIIRESDVSIINCKIKNNYGYYNSYGGGVYCWKSVATIANCDISFNGAEGNLTGGGIYCGGASSNVVIKNCLIADNTAEKGGGIFTDSVDLVYINDYSSSGELEPNTPICTVNITNCTIVNNKLSGNPDQIGGIQSIISYMIIKNSIVWFNSGPQQIWMDDVILDYDGVVTFSNIQGGYNGIGNLNEDPNFASVDTGDYHLKSTYGRYDPALEGWVIDEVDSNCIDAGDSLNRVGPEPSPNGKQINMGAYGGTVQASKSFSPRVLHVDGTGGNNNNSGLSKQDAFREIQEAVNQAQKGDTIMIWPGIYEEGIQFNYTSGSRIEALTIQSAGPETAIITNPAGTAFSFHGAEISGCVIRNLIISGCNAEYESAIYCQYAHPTLMNLTIVNNYAGVEAEPGAFPDIKNCIFWNNQYDLSGCTAEYSRLTNLGDLDPERYNINAEPLFANPGNNDYHLKSAYGRYSPSQDLWVTDPQSSPCIDSGDPGMDNDREPSGGGRINMGAYGGTPYASKSPSPVGDNQ